MKTLTDADFESFIKSKKPVIVDFWAEWCGPCRMSTPIFEELSKEFAGSMEFAKVNVDECSDTATRFNIFSIPTFLIFKNGEQVGEIHGALPKQEFRERLKEFV